MDKVFHLVYLSHAKDNITYSDIQEILSSSKKNNTVNEISGVLLFRDGYFLQLLEGKEEAVLETLSRIIKDRRQHHLQTIIEVNSNQRIFQNWTMNFLDGDTVSGVIQKRVIDIMNLAFSSKHKEKENILPMIRCFKSCLPDLK